MERDGTPVIDTMEESSFFFQILFLATIKVWNFAYDRTISPAHGQDPT